MLEGQRQQMDIQTNGDWSDNIYKPKASSVLPYTVNAYSRKTLCEQVPNLVAVTIQRIQVRVSSDYLALTSRSDTSQLDISGFFHLASWLRWHSNIVVVASLNWTRGPLVAP